MNFLTATPAITADMLKPVVDGVSANIAVIMPIGIALFAIMIGAKLVPKLLGIFLQ